MKNLKSVFALLVLLGSTGIASANEICVTNPRPQVSASVAFPGFRLVFGRPGYYGWYQGRYYSRAAWERFRLQRERIAYRYHRDNDRYYGHGFNRDRDRNFDRNDGREQARNSAHRYDRDQREDFHRN